VYTCVLPLGLELHRGNECLCVGSLWGENLTGVTYIPVCSLMGKNHTEDINACV